MALAKRRARTFWTVSLPEVVVDPVDLVLVEDSCRAASSWRALARSRPNGFSITSRTADSGVGGG